MLGSANLGPSVYLVFTVILLKVVRLLQNLVHMVRLVPQTCTNSPLTTFNHFHIHNKTNMAQESALSLHMKCFVIEYAGVR